MRVLAGLCCLMLLIMCAPPGNTQEPSQLPSVELAKAYQQYLALNKAGKYSEALPHAKRVIKLSTKFFGPEHELVGIFFNNLARLYLVQGNYTEAESYFKRELDISKKSLGPNDPLVGTSINNLAGLYQAQGHFNKAKSLFKRSLEIREKALGPDHPDLAQSYNNLAGLYQAQGRFNKAEPLFKRSLKIREKTLGPDHLDLAQSYNNLAGLYQSQARFNKAEPLFRRSLKIREKTLKPDHPLVAASLNNLALLYQWQGRYSEAEPLLNRSLNLTEKVLGVSHPEMAASLNNLAVLYQTLGRYREAEPLFKRSLKIVVAALGKNHILVASRLSSLAELYRASGQLPQSIRLYKRSLAIIKKTLGPEHQRAGVVLENLGIATAESGLYKEAQSYLRKAIGIYEKKFGVKHRKTKRARSILGRVYARWGGEENVILLPKSTSGKAVVKPVQIAILSPSTLRAARPLVQSAKLLLVGRISNAGNVRLVFVNNNRVTLDKSGKFRIEIIPKDGENSVTILVIDDSHRHHTMSVEYTYQGTLEKFIAAGERYTLVIGNKNYRYWNSLITPHNDAKVVAQLLRDDYGFKTEVLDAKGIKHSLVLLDATQRQIESALEMLRKRLTDQDSLLIYYAGHGQYLGDSKEAYWIPVDGERDNAFTWLGAHRLISAIRRMKARSILVISDSCFSGAMTRSPPDLSAFDANKRQALLKAAKKRARIFVSSGGTEPVLDQGCKETSKHSIFACAFIDALRNFEEPVFSSGELYHMRLLPKVSGTANQQPLRREIRNSNHENGDFIFMRVGVLEQLQGPKNKQDNLE